MFNRREFLKKSTVAVTGASLALPVVAAGPAVKSNADGFKLKYAPHFGMFQNSAGSDLIDQLKFMHDNGFVAMEDNGMMGRDVSMQKKIGETMAKLGMEMGVFVIDFDGWPPKSTLASGDAAWKEKFLKTCREAVEVAKRVNAKHMTVVPGNFQRDLPMGIQTANVIDSLRRGAEILEPHNLSMVLEPLSDNPDLFLRHTDQTYMICKAVNSPACKILFDMYHMQRNEGRLARNIDLTWDEIGYFQIGDEPGRNEPTSGEINYKFLFKRIHDKMKATGRDFIFGMEHGNAFKGKEGEQKLIESYRWSDNF
ncbi:MAG: TIM barrel protein [Spirosomaceae bacterium]|nr:TIM barrel protein [Spirosomataceae bacterium]